MGKRRLMVKLLGNHQGEMDLRAGPPTAERRTRFRSLRGAILARPSPSCSCLPPAFAAFQQQGGKKGINGPPPQPILPGVRHAILELIARPPPQRCPHCRKWIRNERQRK